MDKVKGTWLTERFFDHHKVATSTGMACGKAKLRIKRNQVNIAKLREEIGQNLMAGKDEVANIKAGLLIRETNMMQAHEYLLSFLEQLKGSLKEVKESSNCPDYLVSVLHSILYCSDKLQIEELQEIKSAFKLKYGKAWIENAMANGSNEVNFKILYCLKHVPPIDHELDAICADVVKTMNLPLPRYMGNALSAPGFVPKPLGPGGSFLNYTPLSRSGSVGEDNPPSDSFYKADYPAVNFPFSPNADRRTVKKFPQIPPPSAPHYPFSHREGGETNFNPHQPSIPSPAPRAPAKVSHDATPPATSSASSQQLKTASQVEKSNEFEVLMNRMQDIFRS